MPKITPEQMRAVHAIGRERGLSHESLRSAFGVSSMKDIDMARAAAWIKSFQTEGGQAKADAAAKARKRARRTPVGLIRPATFRQRRRIVELFDELRALAFSEKKLAEIGKRHGMDLAGDLVGGTYSTAAASAAITQLKECLTWAREKASAASATDGRRGARRPTASDTGSSPGPSRATSASGESA